MIGTTSAKVFFTFARLRSTRLDSLKSSLHKMKMFADSCTSSSVVLNCKADQIYNFIRQGCIK